jgi:hypothetical protein
MKETQVRRIQVYVDGEARVLFLGLSVRHAIGAEQVKRVEGHEAVVVDGEGHRVDLDGAVYHGERLQVVRTDPHSDRDQLDGGNTE